MIFGIKNDSQSRGHQQLSFVPMNSQLVLLWGDRGGGGGVGGEVEVVVHKSVTKSTTMLFFILLKATFKKYFLQY